MNYTKLKFVLFPDESKVAKFLFPSPLQFSFYGEIETCCPDLLHQFMCSPYSLFAMDCSSWSFLVYCCCFCLYFGCGSSSANYIGECCESVPWNHTGSYVLSQWNIYIYITKILPCVTSAKSLLWSPKLVTSMK